MPGIDRRTIGGGLFLIGGVTKNVVKLAGIGFVSRSGCGNRSQVELTDRVADAVPGIGRAISIASVRRLSHPDANETHWYRSGEEANRFCVALARYDRALREGLPDAASRQFNGIVSSPILDDVMRRVGLAPVDANAVDRLRLSQIEDNPLGMEGVTLAGELLGEIGIALPERAEVTVRETGEAGVFRAV